MDASSFGTEEIPRAKVVWIASVASDHDVSCSHYVDGINSRLVLTLPPLAAVSIAMAPVSHSTADSLTIQCFADSKNVGS